MLRAARVQSAGKTHFPGAVGEPLTQCPMPRLGWAQELVLCVLCPTPSPSVAIATDIVIDAS